MIIIKIKKNTMKTFKVLIAISLLTGFLCSCSKKNKAVQEYCDCVSSSLNDSLIATAPIESVQKKCYDSIVQKKYDLTKDLEFVNGFDSVQNVKNIKKTITSKISKNIGDILIKYSWQTVPDIFGNETRTYLFDGKMFTQILYKIQFYGSGWVENQRWTGTYKVEVESNGSAYITISMGDNESDIYKLQKSQKDGYCLKGRRTLWQEKR